MKTPIKSQPTWSNQDGFAAIGTAIGVSSLLAIGIYMVNERIDQLADFNHSIEISSQMNNLNVDSTETIAQLIQTGSLKINPASASIDQDSNAVKPLSAGGLGWSLLSAGGKQNEISSTYCNPRASENDLSELLETDKTKLKCSDSKKVTTTAKITRIQTIEEFLADGSKTETTYAVFEITSSTKNRTALVNKKKKARIKIPPPGEGTCPFVDPELNPPKTAKAFDAPFYVAAGRAFVGWTRIGIPVDRTQSDGYAAVKFAGELFKDETCGSHTCNYWAPSNESETIRAWRVQLGGLNFGVQLHIPKESPSSCYLTFHPNRRPTRTWNAGCFAAGTQIRMADMSLKSVEKIEAGDNVYNPVTRSAVTVSRTVAGPEEDPLIKITTGEHEVIVTSKHPFQTTKGLIAAAHLKTGDRILARGGRYQTTTSVETLTNKDPAFVYNFAVASSEVGPTGHMVEADGIVTGDLFLQEQVSGIDRSKMPTSPDITPYKSFITQMLLPQK